MTYFVRWLKGYGWLVLASAYSDGTRGVTVSGFSGNYPLEHVLTWCGSIGVTVLPAAKG